MALSRRTDNYTVSLTDAAGTTEIIQYDAYSGGMVCVPNGSSVTSLTWHAADTAGGTFEPAYDEHGNALTQTVAANYAIQIPSALFGAGGIKAVANAAGDVEVSLKS